MLISTTINDALIEIGVLNPIEEATPQDHSYGLRTLNRIIDSYNTQNLTITYLKDIAYEMPFLDKNDENWVNEQPENWVNEQPEDWRTNNTSPKEWRQCTTIGKTGEEIIDEVAPVSIQGLFWRQNGTDYHSKDMSVGDWSSIGWKTSEGIPSRHYVQRMDNNSIKICFDMIPLYGLEMHLLAKMPWSGKNSEGGDFIPTDDINWGYGFEKMLMLRLAIELCPSYDVEPTQALISKAVEAENYLKTKNYVPRTLKRDSSLGRWGRKGSYSRSNRARY